MQGHTTVDIIMAVLLLSPRLVPSKSMMLFNWAYIIVYAVISFGYSTPWVESEKRPLSYHKTDMLVTVGILCFVSLVADRRKFFIEKGQRSKFFYDQEQQESSKKIFCILCEMVPEHVILPMLKNPGEVVAEHKDTVSILFVMIENFDEQARILGPENLIKFLNNQFTMMDVICSNHQVTKIETVGEEYVCAVGVVPEDEVEAHCSVLERLLKAAADMLAKAEAAARHEAEQRILEDGPGAGGRDANEKLQDDDQVRKSEALVTLKLGMHTGPVVAGVIGQKLPRFRLFGDTVNTAARMMQKGESGCLQFGEETRRHLPRWVEVQERGKIEMKGKGQVTTYLFRGASRQAELSRELERSHVHFGGLAPVERSPSSAKPRSILKQSAARSPNRPTRMAETAEESPSARVRRNTVGTNLIMRMSLPVQDGGLPFADARSSSPSQEEKFQRVLRELNSTSKTFAGQVKSWKWWFSCFLRTPDFSSEVEDKYQRWYHETTICKKLESRLDKQALALTILTAVEVFCCTFVDQLYSKGLGNFNWRGHDGVGWVRLPLFLACRGMAFLIIWCWQQLCRAQHRILRHPHEAQLLLVGSFACIGVLTIISYDAISWFPAVQEPYTEEHLTRFMMQHRRGSSVFSLIMFPVYVLVAMQHQFRFAHTNVFWLVPLVIVTFWQHYCGEEGDVCNLYLSGSSKMMLVLTSLVNSTMAWTAERNSRARFLAARSVQLTRQRIDAIASTLMPPMVVEEMRSLPFDAPLPSHKYQRATIAQSDLCGFTKLASTRMPQEVVQFIGDLFHLFDDLTDKHQVYKVETVGDAYIAGQADLPLTQKNHPVSVVLFGLEMVRAVHSWAGAHGFVDGQGCSVSCRVGIAHGACIGGIVGTEMQRYHLFGELMSELEVLESTAPQGLVQASTACKNVAEEIMRVEKIPSQLLSFEQRDLPYLQTSKGDVVPLEKAGGATFIVKSDSTFRGWIGA